MLIMIILFGTACLKRVVVKPDSTRIPESDFVEVTLRSKATYVLKNVQVNDDNLEGEHQGKVIQIHFSEIESVQLVKKDYSKVLTFYLVGFGIAAVIGYLVRGWDGGPWFD